MYRFTKITALLLVFTAEIAIAACSGTPKFSDVADKDWTLVKVHINSADIDFDRNKLKQEGFGEIFTLRFDAERISGTAAPNHYSAPYTLADKQAITIKQAMSTLMAPLREPEKLREYDYFLYLQNAYKWNIANGNLELYSKGA
ncbi:MAG: META domain-containing protein, partial [Treponema sp.]|nr:META domain-containing protein [Treponema sp.]